MLFISQYSNITTASILTKSIDLSSLKLYYVIIKKYLVLSTLFNNINFANLVYLSIAKNTFYIFYFFKFIVFIYFLIHK